MICSHCGSIEQPERWTCAAELVEKQLCLTCLFWQDVTNQPERVVIDGQCYAIGPAGMSHKGFGGFVWTIRFLNGEIVTTDNLWHRGQVPAVWRVELPDNAEFVGE